MYFRNRLFCSVFRLFENSFVCSQGRLIYYFHLFFSWLNETRGSETTFLIFGSRCLSIVLFPSLTPPLWVYDLTLKQALRLTGAPFHSLKEVSQREKGEAILNPSFLFGSQTLSIGSLPNTCTQLGEQECVCGSLTRCIFMK